MFVPYSRRFCFCALFPIQVARFASLRVSNFRIYPAAKPGINCSNMQTKGDSLLFKFLLIAVCGESPHICRVVNQLPLDAVPLNSL